MDGFLKLNRHKLRIAFLATSLIFLSIALLSLLVGYFNEQLPDTELLLTILLIAGIGFPIYIIALAYLVWLSQQRIHNRAFLTYPFSALKSHGFSPCFLYSKSKWRFTEETISANINGYQIVCSVQSVDKKMLKFKAFVAPKPISKEEFTRLIEQLKAVNTHFDGNGFYLYYDVTKSEYLTVSDVWRDLENLTKTLNEKKLEPAIPGCVQPAE